SDTIFKETFLIAGMGETEIEDRLTPIISEMPGHYSIAYLPALGQVRVRLTAAYAKEEPSGHEVFLHWKAQIKLSLGNFCFATGDTDLETYLGALCRERKLSIGTVESCTGGRVSARIAAIPGAS